MKLKSLCVGVGLAITMIGSANADIYLPPSVLKDTSTELAISWSLKLADLPQATESSPFEYLPISGGYWSSNWYADIFVSGGSQWVFDHAETGFMGGYIVGNHLSTPHPGDWDLGTPGDGPVDYVKWDFASVANQTGSLNIAHMFTHSDQYQFGIQQTAQGYDFTLQAIHAVPEPETYAMLLAGLGVVGWRLRGRKA